MGLGARVNQFGNVLRYALDLLKKADVGVHLRELVPRLVPGCDIPADHFRCHDCPRNNLRVVWARVTQAIHLRASFSSHSTD